MRYEGSPVIAPPLSKRRMTPPTPLQNSYASFEGEQGSYEVEGPGRSARERTIIARTKQYLEESYSVKVAVEELEDFLGPAVWSRWKEHHGDKIRRLLQGEDGGKKTRNSR